MTTGRCALLDNWGLGGKSAVALDASVTSPLLKSLVGSVTAGAATIASAENRKSLSNGPICEALGWDLL